ncbi:sugar transferase [Rhizomicrobium electricum]|uniref:Bacterial sugar transferase domain-containing protein n=1 Tax=Rhizomicrobium electricum TaxID=480070 RepID=A0ABN1EMV2_9PROT|nr:sugar transferase [Rhizomicrobium electricum]NIJ46912.1 lipopolysaccharide/colanic/teichoic acid biosynthesis glycosyltransferase [Rhizomicrobium electricum]
MTIRRLGDIAMALALLYVCLPVIVLGAVAVWVELAAAPFCRVERVTRGGRIVRLWRLRIVRDTEFGPKLTRTGALLHRYHLEQIPQLLNVMNGDLSLLAPDGTRHEAVGTGKAFALRQR